MISMPFTVSLASIPLVVFSFGYVTRERPVPVTAKPVMTETIRAVRMDDSTFRLRWSSVADMPPMRETVTEPLILVTHDAPQTKPIIRHVSRRVSLHRDVCAMHKMRKVHYGRTWRCRR